MQVEKTRFGGWLKKTAVLAGPLLLLLVAQGIFFAGKAPSIEIEPGMPAIGKQTPFQVKVSEARRGLTRVRIECVQEGRAVTLAEKTYSASPQFFPWGRKTATDTLTATAGSLNVQGLAEGTAVIRATADRAATWLRRPGPVSGEISLPVRLTAPSIQVTSIHTYVSRGGSELVTYRVGKTAVRDGVRAGSRWFPGYPLPEGEAGDRFALFSVPYDRSEPDARLVAADDAGNESEETFIDRFYAKSFKSDTLTIGDAFLSKVVPEILSQTPGFEDRGGLLENYLAINRELRLSNAETIVELARKSKPEFLWSGPFLMLPNSKATATFGDNRTYFYQGKAVDRQVHLGIDFASVRNAAIPAPNDGIVVWARYLGIYGNTVVIDHGYGLMSISGHLSSIAVEEGRRVSRGDVIGNTGTTGLAGGDHLHFCTLLQGLPVNPVEWSDGHWIRDRITRKLEEAKKRQQ
ncbi:MAG: M23 family metallopeptidase [Acidobacteria bacterium]|nr:M23 family metallopeptidase [Acidobacteriota bacterium]